MSGALRLAVLVSGGGRTLANLVRAIDQGEVAATVALVVASRPDAPAVEFAQRRGVPVRVADPRKYAREDDLHDAVTTWLLERRTDLVCLAGYVRWFRVDPPFAGRAMNIHPALLPDFGGPGMYGMRVHRAVLRSGATVSGCTVHFVDERYDHGPVILQRRVPVLPDDDEATLAARVFREECRAYPEAIRLFAAGRLRVEDDRVRILPAPARR